MLRHALVAIAATLLLGCGRAAPPGGSGPAEKSPGAAAPARAAAPAPAARDDTATAFERTLELLGIRFVVTSPNTSEDNRVSIAPSGLEIDNRPVEWPVDGRVTDARVADLDADGSPEVYVFATSGGSGSYGSLVGYAANRRKSLSQVYLAPIAEDPKLAPGYMGHDTFEIDGNTLVRRFPVYRDGDANASPSGGTRELRYRLAPGEAGWLLVVDSVVDRP
jgi:hypothetical protein